MLLDHHEHRLAETFDAVSGSVLATAHRISWTRRRRRFEDLDVFHQVLAVGETAAHLDVLVERGELSRTAKGGVLEYRS